MTTVTAQPNLTKKNENRILYLDLLRILATIGVMAAHISGAYWPSADIHSADWQSLTLYTVLGGPWAISAFLFISGSMLLGKNRPVSVILKKNVLRIVTAFLYWTVIYGIEGYLYDGSVENLILNLIYGHYHMWFLYLIVGLYLIIPFLDALIEQKKTGYFLILWAIFTVCLPFGLSLAELILNRDIVFFERLGASFNLKMTAGYSGLFLAGYYLHRIEIPKKIRVLIYAGGIGSFFLLMILFYQKTIQAGALDQTYCDTLTPPVILMGLALFTAFRYGFADKQPGPKTGKLISALSKYSFGAYLCHAVMWEMIFINIPYGVFPLPMWLGIPLLTLAVAILSFGLSAVTHQIPILKKYIV